MTTIAQQTGLSRESLYRAFSKRGNPTVATLTSVLAATGCMGTSRQIKRFGFLTPSDMATGSRMSAPIEY